MPSRLAMQITNDDWAASRQIMPIVTQVTMLADDGAAAAANVGPNVVPKVIDWNSVQLNEPTDLIIAPIDDIEMAEFFGIPVDEKDKKEKQRGEANVAGSDVVDPELMKEAADDVDDDNDEEMINVYDRDNPVIQVGKCFPSMDEFRMCFRTFAVKRQFDTKTLWIDTKKFYAKCRGFDGDAKPCPWYISARRQPDGNTVRVNQIPHEHTCITSSQNPSTMTSQAWVAQKIAPILAKTPNTTAKRLKIDMEKAYPIKLNYTTVWKAKQKAMKELYGDWANTFRMLYSFKAEVEKRSPDSVVVIDTEVAPDGKVFYPIFLWI